METKPEGWWRPHGKRKFHYFRKGQAFCSPSMYGFFGSFPIIPEPPPDACRTCWKKRERELTKKTETEP